MPSRRSMTPLVRLEADVVACRRCPRLVSWREKVGVERRRAFAQETYWSSPVPGFGDPKASLVIIGLAPAAHGGNRTGRMFTGDRSGDWLYGALFRAHYANQPTSVSRHDGLVLRDAFVTAAVRCAPPDNKPSAEEAAACLQFLVGELALLNEARVYLALGAFALRALASALELHPRPRFSHLGEFELADGRAILCSYHPSQRNTFTGTLTLEMFDAVFTRARALSRRGS